ncbi:MAG: type II toxin-antitoxin system VapC family toxin [Ktedonobacteraceae bacterium]
MSSIVLLDTGLLGLITHPKASLEADQCAQWLVMLSMKGVDVKVPEIADYEIRRELLRMDRMKSIKRLDDLKNVLGYIPLNTQTMLLAAEFWAQARKQGRPTADDKALDGDVILAAQASLLTNVGHEAIIATTNVGHLSRFVNAKEWKNIS